MEFSKKILNYSNQPRYQSELNNPDIKYLFKLDNLNTYIEVFIILEKKDGEDFIKSASYKTALSGAHLGLVDGFFSLVNGKALEILDRVSAKELDYFLRDENNVPSIPFYDPKFYDVLSIGEKTLKKFFEKTGETFLYEEYDTDFFEMSFTEQIEMVEEFLSKTIYKLEEYSKIQFDVEDTDNNILKISCSNPMDEGKQEKFKALLLKETKVNNCQFVFN